MPDPEVKLPIDTSVPVPPALAKQVAAANALHERHYPKVAPQVTPPAPAVTAAVTDPQVTPPAPVVADPPVAAVQPTPIVPAAPVALDPDDGANWQHRYLSMKGRFDQSQVTVGQLQQQMSELGDELMRCQQSISQLRAGPQPQRQGQPQRQNAQRLLTDEDVRTYGPELIDVVQRAAREAIQPDLAQVAQQSQQTNQRVMQTAQGQLYADLDRDVPTWRTVNIDPRFRMWCRSQDVYSGVVRGKLLTNAFQAADAPRVVSFFKGFLAEEQATGQVPAPGAQPQAIVPAPRIAAVPLENLTAPGRAKPAGSQPLPNAADKPVYSRAQVSAFYNNVRAGMYVGREAEKVADEALIFAAQAEGRIR